MGRGLASKDKEVGPEVLQKFQYVGIGVLSYAQGGGTIKTSIHEMLSEEHFLIKSKVKYMQGINPQGYRTCIVEVEVEAIQQGHSAVEGTR
jgi:hypothetical protein